MDEQNATVAALLLLQEKEVLHTQMSSENIVTSDDEGGLLSINLFDYKCYYCNNKYFKVFKELDAHLKVCKHFIESFHPKFDETDRKRFKCTLCNKCFKWKSHLQSHQKIHTLQENNARYRCKFTNCVERFTNKHLLIIHHKRQHKVSSRHMENQSEVSSCLMENQSEVLRREKQSEVLSPPWEEQSEVSSPPGDNQSEVLSPAGEIQSLYINKKCFHCDECDKQCSTKYRLTIHKRTHSGERPYKCKLCSRDYTSGSSLNTHVVRVHTSDRSYYDHIMKRNKQFAKASGIDYVPPNLPIFCPTLPPSTFLNNRKYLCKQ